MNSKEEQDNYGDLYIINVKESHAGEQQYGLLLIGYFQETFQYIM